MEYVRAIYQRLCDRLLESPRRLQILAGPRQVGKTTLVRQVLASRPASAARYVAADATWAVPNLDDLAAEFADGNSSSRAPGSPDSHRDTQWLLEEWHLATRAALSWQRSGHPLAAALPFVFVIDEIQKVPQWSATIKGLWDQHNVECFPMHLVLLGSAPLLMQQGLSESLAGRFEVLTMGHWSFTEMNDAFNFSLDQFLYFGGFPGSAGDITDEARWRNYLLHSLIRPNIEKDILAMTRVDKPGLLKHLFEVGCVYSGQIVSLDKVLGQLHDAGNVTTLSRYLDLLGHAGLLAGLQKYAAQTLRQRKSPPKFQVLNNALMSATGSHGFDEARADRSHWGRLVESAVGAHLLNTADADTHIHYWREGALEVDFVIERRGKLLAVEVKSGQARLSQPGLMEFSRRYGGCPTLLVGADALPVGEFLRYPAAHWVA
jgi:uncharacterized protein